MGTCKSFWPCTLACGSKPTLSHAAPLLVVVVLFFVFLFIVYCFYYYYVDGNLKLMTKEGCVKDIYNALVMHGDSKDLVDAACSALWYLSLEGM